MSIELEMKRRLKASKEKVFEAFSEAEVMKEWFAPGTMTVPNASLDKKTGGKYRIEMRDASGESRFVSGIVKNYDPPNKISYTWQWESPDSVETLVTIFFRELENENGKETEITLIHQNFKTEEAKKLHGQGWEGCLGNLEKYFS